MKSTIGYRDDGGQDGKKGRKNDQPRSVSFAGLARNDLSQTETEIYSCQR